MSQRKSRKSPKRSIRSTPSTTFAGRQMRVAPTEKRDRLTALHRQGNFEQVRDCARKIVEEYPEDAFAWTALGSSLLKLKSYEEALRALDTANALFPDDYLILDALAKAHTWLGNHRQAIAEQRRCLELEPEYAAGHFHMAALLNESGSPEALEHLDKAESLGHDLAEVLSLRGTVQTALLQFNAALATFRKLLEIRPDDPSTQNDIANLYKDIGQFRKAEEAYRRALELDPAFVMAYSNQFFSMHYDPERTPESILEFAREWEKRFAPPYRLESPKEANPSPNKRLRVGLLSSGLRRHPVGQMITAGLENLDDSIELYAYSTNNIHDHITERIRNAVASWQPIGHLGEPQLAEKIRQDGIDILIDLSGHGAGSRLQTVSMRPAPIAVKWVGGLVNTMGLESFDYLLSDSIETPSGVDYLYVEKLIRMPDDYICYLPPDYLPPITALPAIVNGYITLGCFNNPAKINPVLLSEWAILMQQIPNSRLLLKGAQYDSPEFREHIREILLEHGIEAERLILEGPSSHKDLLETYNRIDIALDPWPYSGGLTTCEAMLMGVPVVSFPGPTFAGRHSATHLVNAGMPELVTNSWEEYRQRVIELASDWPNLSVIRACLRRVLLQSPVCDGPRFARHFTAAMRAIWQRHCEGKAPAALTLDKEGQAWFEGDSQSVRLQYPPVDVASKVGFDFALQDKIITLDNGGLLVGDPKFAELQKLDTFATIAFDPASKVRNVQQLQQQGELHHYPQVVLGDGQEATLFACLDPAMSATLTPLPAEHQLPGNEQATQVIAKLPIATLRLDDIEGLESIDWLLLDNMNDSLKILENGAKTLSNTLLVQARINFAPTHQHQPELAQISHWLSRYGFSFYRLNNLQHYSHLPKRGDLLKRQATQLTCADAVFIPNAKRIERLSDNQRLKLAFLLHTAYGIQDLSHSLIAQADPCAAKRYLVSQNLLTSSPEPDAHAGAGANEVFRIDSNDRSASEIKIDVGQEQEAPTPDTQSECSGGRFVHICFNNMHIQQFINLIQKQEARAGFRHNLFIERTRSVPGYDVDIQNAPEAVYFDRNSQLEQVVEQCLAQDVLGVFFHGIFFDWQKTLLEKVGNRKKSIWVIWGGDLYTPIKSQKPIPNIDKYIDAVATFEKSEYELFCSHYQPKPLIDLKYGFEFEENSKNLQKENTIFVGNSGDPSNNHIEILQEIAKKKDISKYEIVIPFSYNGTPDYLEKVKAEARAHQLSNVSFIEKMLPKDEYLKRLEKAKMLVTAHDRQQALGNITAAIYYGTSVIIKREISVNDQQMKNTVWEHMVEKNGIELTDYTEFKAANTIGELIKYDSTTSLENRKKIKEIFGSREVAEMVGRAFKQVQELPDHS